MASSRAVNGHRKTYHFGGLGDKAAFRLIHEKLPSLPFRNADFIRDVKEAAHFM